MSTKKDVEAVVKEVQEGKVKISDPAIPPQQLRESPLNTEQMKRAVGFAQKLPKEWEEILPTKKYIKLPRKTDKVAIVGFANSWNKAPYNDPSFEIWGINELYKYLQSIPNGRADRWFEIHDIRNSPSKQRPEHQKWLKSAKIPIYTWDHYDDMPGTVPYPKDDILNKLKEVVPFGYRYFTNQISWMIALAWYEGFKEVHIYGVNMATDSEYSFQRPSVESWVFFLQCMGIKYYQPPECDLLSNPGGLLYGFESDNKACVLVKQRITDLKPKGGALHTQRATAEFKRDEIYRQLRNTEGYITGATDALNSQSREEVERLIKHKHMELNKLVPTFTQLDETIKNCDIHTAQMQGASGAYSDVLNHILRGPQ